MEELLTALVTAGHKLLIERYGSDYTVTLYTRDRRYFLGRGKTIPKALENITYNIVKYGLDKLESQQRYKEDNE